LLVNGKKMSSRTVRSALASLFFFTALGTRAQQPPPSLDGRTAEQAYKNIQVLRGTPASQMSQSMHLMSGALGVNCEYCHVEQAFDKDDIPLKQTAREMIVLMMSINQSAFGGKQVVTCYTCHQGRAVPISAPVLPVPPYAEIKPAGVLPTIDAVLTAYVQALGGEQAMRRVRSRLITATQDIPTGPGGVVPMPARTERYQKAPNLLLNVYHTATYTIANGFDGARAWSQDVRGRVTEALQIDQGRAKRSSDFYEPLRLKEQYAKLEVAGVHTINGREAYVVVGHLDDDLPERLYFDTTTGLLLRRATALPTTAGESPFQIDYDDYRDTGSGVKIPFVIRMTPASPRTELVPQSMIRVVTVQDNIAIDDSKFARPQSQGGSAR
jgi:photosynthetic reaction center cytochrome c subunit